VSGLVIFELKKPGVPARGIRRKPDTLQAAGRTAKAGKAAQSHHGAKAESRKQKAETQRKATQSQINATSKPPQSHPEATLKPSGSQPVGTPKPP
jgi:hypothetical protein